MKTCPVCKTSLFDDMEVCYGCMYAFGSKPELEQRACEEKEQQACSQTQIEQPSVDVSSSAHTPGTSRWSIRLEMRNEVDPARSWSMEFAPSRVMGQPVMP